MLIETKQVNETPSKPYASTLNILCQEAAGGAASTGHITAADLVAGAEPSLDEGYVGFGSASDILTGSDQFTWNDTTRVLNFANASTIAMGIATHKRMIVLDNQTSNDHQFTGIGASSANMIIQLPDTSHSLQILGGTGIGTSSTAHTFNSDGSFVSAGSGQVQGSFKVAGNANPPYITLGDTSATLGNIIGRTNTAAQFFTSSAAGCTIIKDSTASNFIFLGTGTDYQMAIGNGLVQTRCDIDLNSNDVIDVGLLQATNIQVSNVNFVNTASPVGSTILGSYEAPTIVTFEISGPWGATSYAMDVKFSSIGNLVVACWAGIPGTLVTTPNIMSSSDDVSGQSIPTRFVPSYLPNTPAQIFNNSTFGSGGNFRVTVGTYGHLIHFAPDSGGSFSTGLAGVAPGFAVWFT